MRQDGAGGVGCVGEDLSEFINDLHVWFRSFRVKLSRMRILPAPRGESERSFADKSVKLIHSSLVHQFGENRARIEPQRFGQVDELNDIDPALANFDAGNYGL